MFQVQSQESVNDITPRSVPRWYHAVIYSNTQSCFTRRSLALTIVLTRTMEQVVHRVCHKQWWTQCCSIGTHLHFASSATQQAMLGLSCLCEVTSTKAANLLDIMLLHRYSCTHWCHRSKQMLNAARQAKLSLSCLCGVTSTNAANELAWTIITTSLLAPAMFSAWQRAVQCQPTQPRHKNSSSVEQTWNITKLAASRS